MSRAPARLLAALLAAPLLIAPAGFSGCATKPADANTYDGPPPNQKYTLDEVKKRARQLQVGMDRIDVAILLGSPAEIGPTTWRYLPSRPGFLLPTEILEVEFSGRRYVSHRTRAVILGERPAD